MPAQGTDILAQIEELCQQFLALDYDTPVKAEIGDMSERVRGAMDMLASEVQPEDEMPTEEKPQSPMGFKGATEAAMQDEDLMKNMTETPRMPKGSENRLSEEQAAEEEVVDDDDDPRRKKIK